MTTTTTTQKQRRYYAPRIRTFTLPEGQVGKSYRAFLHADGEGPFRWTGFGLPDGMWVGELGAILGSPKNPGLYPITVIARNFFAEKRQRIHLRIRDRYEAPPRIMTPSLPPARAGREYFSVLEASTTVVWSSPDLPKGVFVDRRTGVISGTPIQEGVHTVHITAANRWGEHTITTHFDVF